MPVYFTECFDCQFPLCLILKIQILFYDFLDMWFDLYEMQKQLLEDILRQHCDVSFIVKHISYLFHLTKGVMFGFVQNNGTGQRKI